MATLENYFSLKQAAEACGVPYAALRREIENGNICACRVGRKYFLSQNEVGRFQEDLQKKVQPEGYTIKEIMAALPLSYAFLIDLIKKGRLEAVECGRSYIIPKEALEVFLAQAEAAGKKLSAKEGDQ